MVSLQIIVKIGLYLIIFGFILLIAGFFASFTNDNDVGGQFGGLVLIGPIPIVFGTSPEITADLIYVGFIMFLIYVLLWRKI
ncbi:MAG: DUF131 domain-containing protein [Methanomethylovorans sp.]|jgi:uncharacterized protein (TIGR00304 family)|nr:DUF131 domain-containing protein [Methanomethylovorans sp.]